MLFSPHSFRAKVSPPLREADKSLCYSRCSSELTPTGKRDNCGSKAHYYDRSVTMNLSVGTVSRRLTVTLVHL